MLHTGTYRILVHNISDINEKNGRKLILHSSRGLTGIRNLIWLHHWEEEGKAAGQHWEVEGKKKRPLTWVSTQLRSWKDYVCQYLKAAESGSR